MEWLIWTGTLVSLIGLTSLFWSIIKVAQAKRAQLDDAALREAIRRAMPFNMGGLALSVLGLMAVMVGISLG
ncbi:hypothetical protein [Pseudooceanicola algae]|uniref:Uncharacterized protein n=1 Tax=Pseudooceanicola algae TaxID=1537215 RepID=A0A418SKA6_9RHOB|nr:hypothetical protein [Pseudooceanicola algae]QPM89105.1 hypothetical protein PSAL_003150 [Pseudooceanicola algae]